MKNKRGIISGYVLGSTGFLLLFKLIFRDNIPPADEPAPGIVAIASILNGLLFAFAGHLVQNYLGKRETKMENISGKILK